MYLTTAVIVIAVLDLGVIAAVAAVMYLPFTLDRSREPASVRTLEGRTRLELAA